MMNFQSRLPCPLGFASLLLAMHIAFAPFAEGGSRLRAYAMDTEEDVVHSISLDDGKVLTSPKLEGTPNIMLLSPDGSRLLLFERATVRGLEDKRWPDIPILRPTKPTALDILDTQDMRLVSRVEDLGWNAAPNALLRWPLSEVNALWGDSGRLLTILCWGKKGHNPELVQVDVQKGSVTGRFSLQCSTDEVSPLVPIVPGASAALTYENREEQDRNKAQPTHKLVLVDLGSVSQSKEITLPGFLGTATATILGDGEYVYVLANGSRDNKGPADAHLHVVSSTTKSLVKSINRGFIFSDATSEPESGLTLIARIGKKGEKSSLLALSKGQEIWNIEIPDSPLHCTVGPKTRRLYLLCYDSIQVVDLQARAIVGAIATPHRERGFWESGAWTRPPSALAFDSRESIGVLGYSGDDEFSVCDLAGFKVKATVDLVSGWESFAWTMAAAAASGALAGALSGATGVPVMTPTPTNLYSPEYSTMLLDPSDRYLYVLGADQLDIIDMSSYTKVGKRPLKYAPRYAYYLPQLSNSFLYVVGMGKVGIRASTYRLGVIDMKTNEEVLKQGWLGDCTYSADGRYAVNFDSRNVYLLDGPTLSEMTKIGGFKELRQLLVAPLTERASP